MCKTYTCIDRQMFNDSQGQGLFSKTQDTVISVHFFVSELLTKEAESVRWSVHQSTRVKKWKNKHLDTFVYV